MDSRGDVRPMVEEDLNTMEDIDTPLSAAEVREINKARLRVFEQYQKERAHREKRNTRKKMAKQSQRRNRRGK